MLKRTVACEATIYWSLTRLDGVGYEATDDNPMVGVEIVTRAGRHFFSCDRFVNPVANLRDVTKQICVARRGGLGAKVPGLIYRGSRPGSKSGTHAFGLGPDASRADVISAFRKLALEKHPDHGGTAEEFMELLVLRDEALRGARP